MHISTSEKKAKKKSNKTNLAKPKNNKKSLSLKTRALPLSDFISINREKIINDWEASFSLHAGDIDYPIDYSGFRGYRPHQKWSCSYCTINTSDA